MTKQVGKISLYATGGCGINIGRHFDKFREQTDPGYAIIETTYIDTSRSNVTTLSDSENVYILDGLDGSGKVRAENHVQISECVLDILQNHKPGDLNIVLSSTGGGKLA